MIKTDAAFGAASVCSLVTVWPMHRHGLCSIRVKSAYMKKKIRLLSPMESHPFLFGFSFTGFILETVVALGPHRSREHLAFLSKLYRIDRSI